MRRFPRTVVLAVGALGVAILLLSVGMVAGAAWQSRDDDRAPAMTAVDVGFAQDMSVHHDQAILLSTTVAGRPGVGPEISGLANRIITAQTAENATLRGWLTWFGKPLTSGNPMGWMAATHDDAATGSGHGHGATAQTTASSTPSSSASSTPSSSGSGPAMAGMASTDDISKLAGLTGRDAEVWFLQLMIRHHRGGMLMAKSAYNSDDVSDIVKRTAYEMMTDQGEEISLMTMLLTARGAQALPA